MAKIKQPKIRFKGYIANWEQYKLGKVCKVTMGCSPSSLNYTDNPNDYILVQGNADMKNGRVFPRVYTTQVTKTAEPNDIILSVRAPVGDVGKTDFNVVLGRGVAGIKGNDFIHQYLIKMKEQGYWIRYSTGSTFESINSNDLKDAIINIPNIEEQNKIGEFFKTLDDTITLHQQKLEVAKQFKQTMLKKMFPKNGETTPEIRFKGFTEDWEECKLRDLCSLSTGKLDANAMTSDGKYTFFTSGEKVYKTDTFAFDGDAILIAGNGNVGLQHTYNGKFNAYQRTYVLMDFEINKEILSKQIDLKLPRVIARETRVGVIPYIVKDMLTELTINFPKNIKEQDLIGNYFKELDNQINALEQKLEKYKEFKKTMLQKMFT